MDNTTAPGAGPLDRFLPTPDIRERHQVVVRAPANVVYREAMAFDLESLFLVRVILRGREILMGSKGRGASERIGFVARTRTHGWAVLAEEPGCLYLRQAVPSGAQSSNVVRVRSHVLLARRDRRGRA